MRRTMAAVLVAGMLTASMPAMSMSRGDRDWNPIHFIAKIVKHLLPSTNDDNNILPPKP